MNLNDELDEIRDFLGKNKIEEVFKSLEILIDRLNDKEIKDSFILIKNKYNSIKNEHLGFRIKYEDAAIFYSKIFNSLLELISKIENDHSPNKASFNEIHDQIDKRAIALADKARFFFNHYGSQIIRQKAINSSFSLPNRDEKDSIWEGWLKPFPLELGKERFWLEKHIQSQYVKLIIMPFAKMKYKVEATKYAATRLKILFDFISSNKDKVDIVTITEDNPAEFKNLTIIGNYFYAESGNRQNDSWLDTSISTKDVDLKIKEFDSEFNVLLNKKGLDIFSAREKALEEIRSEIIRLDSTKYNS